MTVAEMSAEEKQAERSQKWMDVISTTHKAMHWMAEHSTELPDSVTLCCNPRGVEVRLGYLFASSPTCKRIRDLFAGMAAKQITRVNGDKEFVVTDPVRNLTFAWTVWAEKKTVTDDVEQITL